MMADAHTLIQTTRQRLAQFWDNALQIERERDHLVVAFPLMLPDGLQIVFELKPITATTALLSDSGTVLSRIVGDGLKIESPATAQQLDQRLAFFGIERDGFELRRPAKLPIEAVEIQLFAEGLSSIAHLIDWHNAEAEEENVARKSIERVFSSRKLEPLRNHALEGRLEKTIRVNYFIPGAHGLALQVVDRKTDLHGYMQQWGWRWTDLHEKQAGIIRAMVYDPDRQDWDATALDIGRSVCEVFCPYHESEEISRAIEMAQNR